MSRERRRMNTACLNINRRIRTPALDLCREKEKEVRALWEEIYEVDRNIALAKRDHAAAMDLYRDQEAGAVEGARLLAYRNEASQVATQVSQVRAVSLGVAGLIVAAALLTPGIGTAVPLVAVAVGAQAWMVEGEGMLPRLDLLVFFGAFAVPVLICRLVHDAARTNWPMLRRSRRVERLRATGLMAWRSTWIVVVLGALISASMFLEYNAQKWLYALPVAADTEIVAGCPKGETLVFRQPALEGCAPRRPEADIEASLHWHLEQAERNVLSRIDEGAREGSASAQKLGSVTIDAFDEFIPKRLASDEGVDSYVSSGFDKRHCRWWDPRTWTGCLVNKMLELPRTAYANSFDATETGLEGRVNAAVKEAEGDVEEAQVALGDVTRDTTAELRDRISQGLGMLFRGMDVLRLAAVFLLIFTILRVFAHIFLRCFTGAEEFGRRLMRLDPGSRSLPGRTALPFRSEQVDSQRSEVLLRPGQSYRIRRKYEPNNLTARFVWPRIISAPRGGFREYEVPLKGSGATIKLPQAIWGVRISVDKKQRLAFDGSAFIGFSGDITFRKVFQQSIISLLSGRLRTLVAIGPGEIILLSSGEPERLLGGTSEETFIRSTRMLAWSQDWQFVARADPSTSALVWNAPQARPLKGGLVVTDAARHSQKRPPLFGLFGALLSQV